MPGEIPACELRERPRPVEGRWRTEPVAGGDVGVLPGDQRAAHGDAMQAREHEQVDERLPLRRHSDSLHPVAELVARQRALGGQRAFDCGNAALRRARRHAELCQSAGVASEQGRRRQRMQPPVVLPANQVQRAAVEPADDDRTLVGQLAVEVGGREPARACANGEPGAPEILGLHGQEALADPDDVAGAFPSEKLRRESPLENRVFHAAATRPASRPSGRRSQRPRRPRSR